MIRFLHGFRGNLSCNLKAECLSLFHFKPSKSISHLTFMYLAFIKSLPFYSIKMTDIILHP